LYPFSSEFSELRLERIAGLASKDSETSSE